MEEQVRPREDIRKPPGAINPSTIAIGQEEQHWFEPPNGARSKWPRHGLPLPSPVTGATANVGGSGADRPGPDFFVVSTSADRVLESPTRVDLERNRDFPGPGGQLLGDGTQFDSNPYADVRARHIDPDRWDQPHANRGGQNLTWSPNAALMDTVARLQRDLDEMRAESRYLRTPGGRDSLRPSRQVTFTSTKVPKFAGVTSWEQYRQVFDAIVLSNGWDDATAALQLLSSFEWGRIECGYFSTGIQTSVASGISGCTVGTLWISRAVGRLWWNSCYSACWREPRFDSLSWLRAAGSSDLKPYCKVYFPGIWH